MICLLKKPKWFILYSIEFKRPIAKRSKSYRVHFYNSPNYRIFPLGGVGVILRNTAQHSVSRGIKIPYLEMTLLKFTCFDGI